MADRQWGIAKRTQGETRSHDEMLAQVIGKFPIELDPPLKGLAKPLIIEVACPGWQPKRWPPKWAYKKLPPNYEEGGIRYPAVPTSIADQVANLVEAVQAGCAAIHVHVRDPQDWLSTEDTAIQKQVFDGVFNQVDCVTLQHTWLAGEDRTIDYLHHTKTLLEQAGGNRFCQGAVMLWPPGDSYPISYEKSVTAAIELFEANDIKPIHFIRGSYHVRKLRRTLIDTGMITREPHVLVHDMGHPYGWPMDIDPWMPFDMITSLEQSKARIPGSIIGVYSGGRNWLPITLSAILSGVDMVRVGVEDCYWMYPHKDEVIARNIDCVTKIVDFCKIIGRDIATPEQARQVLGIKRTS